MQKDYNIEDKLNSNLENNFSEINMMTFKTKLLFVTNAILLTIVFLLAQAFLQGCDDLSVFSDKKRLHGSGRLESQTLDITGFNSILVQTFGNVQLTQSDNFEVTFTIDDNLADHVEIYRSGNSLIVDIDDNYNYQNCSYNVSVSMPDINKLTTNSAGSIRSLNEISEESLDLTANSAGNITLYLNATNLFTSINSAGNMNLSGFADSHRSNLESAGNLNAFELETNTTIIDVSSAGNGRVYVNDYLDANLSSAGSLYYKGHPEINYHRSSLGNLYDAN